MTPAGDARGRRAHKKGPARRVMPDGAVGKCGGVGENPRGQRTDTPGPSGMPSRYQTTKNANQPTSMAIE